MFLQKFHLMQSYGVFLCSIKYSAYPIRIYVIFVLSYTYAIVFFLPHAYSINFIYVLDMVFVTLCILFMIFIV